MRHDPIDRFMHYFAWASYGNSVGAGSNGFGHYAGNSLFEIPRIETVEVTPGVANLTDLMSADTWITVRPMGRPIDE